MGTFQAKVRDVSGLRGFSQLIKPWSGTIALIVLLVAGLALADMVLPWALALLIDDAFPALSDGNGWELLWVILGSLCIIYVLRNVLYFVSRMLSVRMSEQVCFDLRERLFNHLQQLGMSFYKLNRPGQVSARIMDDTFRIQTFIQDKLPTLMRYIIEFQILIILLYVVNWKLALASTIVLPFHLWTYKKFYSPIRDHHHQAQEHLADAHGSLIESFLGVQVVKGFSAERRESESFLETIRANRDVQIKTKRFQFAQKVVADLFVGLGTILLLGYGAWEVYAGAMSIGVFLMFFWYVRMLYPAVLEIVSGTGHFSRTSASVDRVLEMLEEPVDEIVYDMRTRTQTLHLVGPIEFKDVSFHYEDDEEYVIQNINLHIDAGEHVALTGPSGAGKSTLISLMPRFNDPKSGTITVGGDNIRDIRLQDVRGMFGVAFQDVFLFKASIYENLKYAKPSATPREIIEACKVVGAHDFIHSLPNGYHTIVGSSGGEFSHGEKQRINLARALVRSPQTLIIDESTASIEADAASSIVSSILEHMTGRTVIVVTHDPNVMQLMNRVVTLDKQTIVSDHSKDGKHMKHPTTKSNLGMRATMFVVACLLAVGCSSTVTTSTIELEEPKATGIVIESGDTVNLSELQDAIDELTEDVPTIPIPQMPEPLTAEEIAELVIENETPTIQSTLIELPRLNRTELDEIVERTIDAYQVNHGYQEANQMLGGVLPLPPDGVTELTSIAKKNDGTTSIIRFGFQTFLSQPPLLWVEGTSITDGVSSPNLDADLATNIVASCVSSLESMRAALTVRDLDKKIIQLSYIDSENALKLLNGLGVTTFEDAATVPDDIQWEQLPYVVQIPEPSDKSIGLVGGSSVMGGNFGLTTVPKVAGALEGTTDSSRMTQLLVFFDPVNPEQFSEVQQMIDDYIDLAAKQIFIEGMVLEINEDGLKDIGINWHMLDSTNEDLIDVAAGKANAGTDGDTLRVILSDIDLERAFTRFNEWLIDVDLRALVRDGKAEILSRPSVLTLNNRQATIRVGEDIPIATSASGINNSDMLAFNFQYLPVGIMLNIRPRIAANGTEISMMIDTIVSSEVLGGGLEIRDSNQNLLASAPKISSRRVQTYGRIPNNTPFIIGGLVNKEHHTIHDKIPFLGDLPFIGGLFRADRTTSQKTEVIIVLTPHVLPSAGKHLSAMPKDDPRFDDFGNELFRDSYRIRDDDVFDLKFLEENESLMYYRDIAKQAIEQNYRLAENSAYAPFAYNTFPGEPILVSRMIYEIIKRLDVAEKIHPSRLAFFKGEVNGGMDVQFLDAALAKSIGEYSMEGFFRDTTGKAFALTFTAGEGLPVARSIQCPDRETWRSLLWELNQPVGGVNRHTIIIEDESDLMRVRRAVALKNFLAINSGDASLQLNQFKVGQYVLVPDLDPSQVHIIDAEVAKYFYQTEHYYGATLYAIEKAIERLKAELN
ncbi:MAG: ATP-binding cassette domain-containing protein [Phycisphaerales bacterium]|nr:ATP-binding cassette domain-containing protein [Phycisphaerales bacterium]